MHRADWARMRQSKNCIGKREGRKKGVPCTSRPSRGPPRPTRERKRDNTPTWGCAPFPVTRVFELGGFDLRFRDSDAHTLLAKRYIKKYSPVYNGIAFLNTTLIASPLYNTPHRMSNHVTGNSGVSLRQGHQGYRTKPCWSRQEMAGSPYSDGAKTMAARPSALLPLYEYS